MSWSFLGDKVARVCLTTEALLSFANSFFTKTHNIISATAISVHGCRLQQCLKSDLLKLLIAVVAHPCNLTSTNTQQTVRNVCGCENPAATHSVCCTTS